MNAFVVLAGLLALASGSPVPEQLLAQVAPLGVAPLNAAPYLVRAPAHDSASIESHRLGGNFAYATAEAHAYAQVTPQLSTLTHPVAETTIVEEPAPIATVHPGRVITTNHVPQAIIGHQPILAQEPIVQARTTVHQPIYKTRTYTQAHLAPAYGYAHHGLGYAQAPLGLAPAYVQQH